MMKEEQQINFLRRIELFSSLTDGELKEVIRTMQIRGFKRNETILHEEDTNEFMYIIFDGEVKVGQITEDGKEIILAMHRSGDFFGEISLIDDKTTPATVVATKNSITAIISKKDFFTLIFSQKKVLNKLLQILCSRFRDSLQTIQMLTFNNATQRVKMLFIMLYEKYGKKENGTVVLDMKLTHQDMAEMTGMTRETVTRVIDKWQKDGEIAILKNRLIRLSQDFLKKP